MLDRLAAGESLAEANVAELMRQLLSGLDYCHSHDVVQGHLQPEDILFEAPSFSSKVRVANCGRELLLKPISPLAARADSVLVSLTPQLHFLAPERLLHNLATAASDIWSCGVCCYLLLAGDFPFNGRSRDQLISSIQTGRLDFTGG